MWGLESERCHPPAALKTRVEMAARHPGPSGFGPNAIQSQTYQVQQQEELADGSGGNVSPSEILMARIRANIGRIETCAGPDHAAHARLAVQRTPCAYNIATITLISGLVKAGASVIVAELPVLLPSAFLPGASVMVSGTRWLVIVA